MINADKYLKDGVDIYEIANGINEAYLDSYDEEDLVDCVERWFSTTIKPTLTEDEKVILRNIDKKWTIIGRGREEMYFANKNEENVIHRERAIGFYNRFQSIQIRRRI